VQRLELEQQCHGAGQLMQRIELDRSNEEEKWLGKGGTAHVATNLQSKKSSLKETAGENLVHGGVADDGAAGRGRKLSGNEEGEQTGKCGQAS
jgi:hypothetical protein